MVKIFIIQKKESIFNTHFLHLANSNYTILYIYIYIYIYICNNLRFLNASDVGTTLGIRMKYGPPILLILGTT